MVESNAMAIFVMEKDGPNATRMINYLAES